MKNASGSSKQQVSADMQQTCIADIGASAGALLVATERYRLFWMPASDSLWLARDIVTVLGIVDC